MIDLSEDINLEKNKKDDIAVVIDRLVLKTESRSRLFEALEAATKLSGGKVVLTNRADSSKKSYFSYDIDFDGNLEDSSVKNALRGLREEAKMMKILGNY